MAAQTEFRAQIDAFVHLESQSGDRLAGRLAETFEKQGYRAIRERPILLGADGRAVVLDPTMFYEKIAVGPLFYVVSRAEHLRRNGSNRAFGGFGEAFEDYAEGVLRRMHPPGQGLVDRVIFGAEGADAEGKEFEIDALMVEPVGGIMAAIVVETKAVFLGEGEILNDVTELFVTELIKKYGRDKGGKERAKGVAQLARSVGLIARREWAGEKGEIVGAFVLLPVLLVHDARLDSPGTCAILNDHFKEQIGTVPTDVKVGSLILLTIEDLENLESSVGRFSLAELLWDYHRECPDRLVSLRHFLIGSKYFDLIRPSDNLMSRSNEHMEAVSRSLFPRREDAETTA